MTEHRHASAIGSSLCAVAVVLALSACTAAQSEAPPDLPPAADCGADALQPLAGQPVTGEAPGEITVGGTPIAVVAAVRVIYPDTAVTQDYLPERLNLDVDEAGNLTRAWCG